ncbi:MAG: SDR family oxidoreductase [Acidobacteria bacterium]|nr:SDR family oxidoreductase [Acidobacteriota bacterium]
MILITGATGTTGREIVEELRRAGASGVRALVRDPARASFIREAGFETAEGDFDRPETLGAALEGVERALLLTPPSPQTVEHNRAFIDAARRSGLRHVVKISALGADAGAPDGFSRWHWESEELLKSSGLAWTMLQPNSFMQNLLGQAGQIAATGQIFQPVGDARIAFIDVRDIAAVAARALTEDGHERETYVLSGPEPLTFHDVAAKLSDASGRKITYAPVTAEQYRAGALAAGLPGWLVDALEQLNVMFAAGHAAEVTDVVRRVGRTEPITFDRFAREHARAFAGE